MLTLFICICLNLFFFRFTLRGAKWKNPLHEPLTPAFYPKLPPPPHSITLATFTTLDRLNALVTLADQWAPLPIVVAVYVPFNVPQSFSNEFVQWSHWDLEAEQHWQKELVKVRNAREKYPNLADHVEIHFLVQVCSHHTHTRTHTH